MQRMPDKIITSWSWRAQTQVTAGIPSGLQAGIVAAWIRFFDEAHGSQVQIRSTQSRVTCAHNT
ncbi:hypothetical protein TKWG_23680 [Advenella kashmirensis WT001]|uniref:Uncharacterized protein n=1 Tax=Advenella kashmirensis (strain DSM 17095 / LMG 22695 / WT001) TaxID=1036672 RepID=I3UH39_ADVKW|nr:hypothetical protein TKWG_23680 [Advenella kashmirensis WT001]